MKIEIHTQRDAVKATRAKDSTTVWIEVVDGSTELALFLNADQTERLVNDLAGHLKAVRAIEAALEACNTEAVA